MTTQAKYFCCCSVPDHKQCAARGLGKFTASVIRLLIEYLQTGDRAERRRELLAKLSAISDAIKTTRNTFQWLRQLPFLVQLSKTPAPATVADVCAILNKVCMIVFVTMKNVEWLIGVKILKADAGRFLKLGFKFYTLAWLCELIPRLAKHNPATANLHENLLTARDTLLVYEGTALSGWLKADGRVLALIGIFTSGYECFLTWS